MIRLNRGDQTLDELYSTIWSLHNDGPEPSAAEFLADHPDAPPAERLDVLLTDQLLRWRSGRPKPIADYLAEHPSVAENADSILKLIQGEFRSRLDRGETPDSDTYKREFLWLAEEICLQCEVDRWLTMRSPSDQPPMATTLDYQSDDHAERNDDDVPDDRGRPASASQLPADLDAPLAEADFELMDPLGSGGMGEVYEAVQKSLRKRVALKLIHREALDAPSRVRRFFAEGRALARLRHPHVVGVHGIGRMHDGRYFLVMDLIEDGATLASLFHQGPVPFDRAAALVATVAEAIEHAHSRGVIHRDLKPSNVLLDAEGRPHVTDFGLAKVFDAADPDNPQTTADRILGTPHYMAPEQADPARAPITPRTDVYALGGLLYALLTGKPPIQGDSLTAILTRVVSPEPVPSPRELRRDVPAALERICRTCLEKDAEKRYPSAGAVAVALRGWLADPDEDCTGVKAGSESRSTGSSDVPDTGRSRSGWATDRSLKEGRQTPNRDPWFRPRAALTSRVRRRFRATGAGVSTLALLVLAGTFVWIYERMQFVAPRRHVEYDAAPAPVDPPPPPPVTPVLWESKGYAAVDPSDIVPEHSGFPMRLKRKDDDAQFVFFGERIYLPDGYEPASDDDLTAGSGWPTVIIRKADKVRFIRIQGAVFRRGDPKPGAPDLDSQRHPMTPHYVRVGDFYIQETEVTIAEFDRFAKQHPDEPGLTAWNEWRAKFQEDHPDAAKYPAAYVDYGLAKKYARSVGGLLPTEAEWEWAAKSRHEEFLFAWGSDFTPPGALPRARLKDADDTSFGSVPAKRYVMDQTNQHVYDLVGNVRELCADAYVPYTELPLKLNSASNPLIDKRGLVDSAASDVNVVVRGGSFQYSESEAKAYYRWRQPPRESAVDVGFRVVIECPPNSERTP